MLAYSIIMFLMAVLFTGMGIAIYSGIIGLFENLTILAVAILMIGLVIGIGCIVAVQRKYNKGVF